MAKETYADFSLRCKSNFLGGQHEGTKDEGKLSFRPKCFHLLQFISAFLYIAFRYSLMLPRLYLNVYNTPRLPFSLVAASIAILSGAAFRARFIFLMSTLFPVFLANRRPSVGSVCIMVALPSRGGLQTSLTIYQQH